MQENNLKFVKTDDGSFTCYNQELNEKYHSQCGAIKEALEKYIQPLELEDGMKILDFCFGLGYNSFVATEERKNLEIVALENDFNILDKIKDLKNMKNYQGKIQKFSDIHLKNKIVDKDNNSIKLILDNALNSIKSLQDDFFDRIFFDPFSPNKQPEMWDVKVFEDIFRILKPGGKLATYSCSKRIRKNMKEVGFIISDGPSVGRKSPSTIAEKPKNHERF